VAVTNSGRRSWLGRQSDPVVGCGRGAAGAADGAVRDMAAGDGGEAEAEAQSKEVAPAERHSVLGNEEEE
jgi:hypothetical protein